MKVPRQAQKKAQAVDAAVEAGMHAATTLLGAELAPEELGKQAANDVVRVLIAQMRRLGVELTAKEQNNIEHELRQLSKTYRASADRMDELARGDWLEFLRSSD